IGHIYDQTHTRYLPDLGGLAHQVPFIAGCGMVAAMASSGLPGFANFVAELLVFLGGWSRHPIAVTLGVLGVVITSVYMLRFVRGTFFGPSKNTFSHVQDARSLFARLPYLVLIAALFIVGCWPQPLVGLIDSATQTLLSGFAYR
ncbi:MAG: NADH-quinone oxidoreductase subunit M, partial [Candidatus Omnitrophica bacterium]|nr:NADH-quinone oxidoreductase subunit M [Candidatus Omnitrophota bacterium]